MKRIASVKNKFVLVIIDALIVKVVISVCSANISSLKVGSCFSSSSCLGGRCSADAGDTIDCLTQIEPKLIFECLSPNQICDGRSDCLNNDDEYSCGSFDSYRSNVRLVMSVFFLRIEIDKCAHDSWLCMNGKCIKKDLLCNSRPDCTDGSDEGDFCHSHLCGVNKFRCHTGECISKTQVGNSLHFEAVVFYTCRFVSFEDL